MKAEIDTAYWAARTAAEAAKNNVWAVITASYAKNGVTK